MLVKGGKQKLKVKLKGENFKSDYVASLLRARGIENVELFLNPDESCLQSYRDLENIEEGIKLIKAIPPKGRVGLIVDADVDGFTSAAIIYQYLLRIYPNLNIHSYIHEGKGHGLSEHWEDIRDENYDAIIIPDAATNDSEFAREIKCPILILDHHIAESTDFASNMIVINNQISPKYRNKFLSGAGVVYQFCRALDEEFSVNYADEFIDLAAMGVCGDMMSGLEAENQYIWKEGFNKIKNYFFLSLARKQGYSITGKMNPSDEDIIDALNPTSVAFYIVPLINAMVRMGTMEEKQRMFTAFVDGYKLIPCNKRGAKGTLEEAAIESTRECVNARSHQNKAKEEAVARLEQKIYKHDLLENQILFIRLDDDDNFPAELNGLVAMMLSQKYKRPTIVARLNDEGYIRGSIRGLNNSELTSFKNYLQSTDLFEYVQGHDNAAGCSIKKSDLPKLHERANIDLAQYDFGSDYYEVDFERQAMNDDLTNLITEIGNYKFIWTTSNDEPLIYIKDLHFKKSEIQVLGKDGATFKVVKNGVAYMKFFAKDLIEEIKALPGEDVKIEVVGKANLNEWGGRVTPQIIVEKIDIKEDSLLDF